MPFQKANAVEFFIANCFACFFSTLLNSKRAETAMLQLVLIHLSIYPYSILNIDYEHFKTTVV